MDTVNMLTEENLINHDLTKDEHGQEPIASINKNDKILQSLIDNLTKDLERVISIKNPVVLTEFDDSVQNSDGNDDFARLKRSQPLTGKFFLLVKFSTYLITINHLLSLFRFRIVPKCKL